MRFPRPLKAALAAAVVSIVTGCTLSTPAAIANPVKPADIPTRWDHRPEAALWNAAAFQAMANDSRALITTVPADIDTFCPGYAAANEDERKAFWTAFFSGLAGFESTWRPEAAGAGGRYRGLLQIWPTSARFHGCDIAHPDELFDGAANLRCGARIAAQAVARDGVVAGGPGRWGGVARDWPPLRNATKRNDIAAFTRSLPVCQG